MTKFHLFSQDSVRLETAPTGVVRKSYLIKVGCLQIYFQTHVTKILWQKGSRFRAPTALLHFLVLMFHALRCYTTGLPPTGLKQGRDCLQASGDTNWSSGPTSCMVQLHQ